MEAAFGEDFSGVDAETGLPAEMETLNAFAAASGESIAFADPDPDEEEVAHELTHVVQQRRSGGPPALQAASEEVSSPEDPAEQEAEAVGARVAAGGEAGSISATPEGPVQRKGKGPRKGADYYRDYVVRRVILHLDPARVVLDDPDPRSPAQLLRLLFAVQELRSLPEIKVLLEKYNTPEPGTLSPEAMQKGLAYARATLGASDSYRNMEANFASVSDLMVAGLPNLGSRDLDVYISAIFLHHEGLLAQALAAVQARPVEQPREEEGNEPAEANGPAAPPTDSTPEKEPAPADEEEPGPDLTFHLGARGQKTDPSQWYACGADLHRQYRRASRAAREGNRTAKKWRSPEWRKGRSKEDLAEYDGYAARYEKEALEQLQLAVRLAARMKGQRPYKTHEIWTDLGTFHEQLTQIKAYGYTSIHLDVVTADPRGIDHLQSACRMLGSRIGEIRLNGTAMSQAEFLALAEYTSWGQTPAASLTGEDLASPEGRRHRSESVEWAGTLGREIEFTNAPAPVDPEAPLHRRKYSRSLSTLGSASGTEIQKLLEKARRQPKRDPGEVLREEARTTRSAAGVKLDSNRKGLKGKTLQEASKWLGGRLALISRKVERYVDYRGRDWSYAWLSQSRKKIHALQDREVTEATVEEIHSRVEALEADVDRVTRPLFEKVREGEVRTRMMQIRAEMQAFIDPDERKVSDAFFGLNRAEIMRLEGMYAEVYSSDLRDALRRRLGGLHEEEALAYLDLDLAQATALRLRNSVTGWTRIGDDDEQRIYDTLEKAPPEVLKKLDVDATNQQEKLLAEVKGRLGGKGDVEKKRFAALLGGRRAMADALALMEHLGTVGFPLDPRNWGEAEEEALGVLRIRGADTRHLAEVAAEYERLTGRKLNVDLGMLNRYQAAEGRARLAGKQAEAAAARLQNAAKGPGTSEKDIREVYEGKPKALRAAIDKAFQRYEKDWRGAFPLAVQNMFAEEADDPWELDSWEQLRSAGRVEPALALYIAMKGWGTDDNKVKQTLAGLEAGDKVALARRFRDYCYKYGDIEWTADASAVLKAWLESDLSGRTEHEAFRLLRGKPETPKQMLEDLRSRHDYDLGEGSNAASDWVMGASHGGMIADLERFKGRLEEMVDPETGTPRRNPKTGKPYTLAEIREVYELASGTMNSFVSAKQAVVKGLKSGTKIAVALVATVVSSGGLSPWLVAALSEASGIGVEVLLEGPDKLGKEEVTREALLAALAVGLARYTADTSWFAKKMDALATHFGEGFAKEVVKAALIEGVKGGATGALEAALDGENWRKGVLAWVAGIGKTALGKGVQDALGGAGGAFVKEIVKPAVLANTFVDPRRVDLGDLMGVEALGKVAEVLSKPETWLKTPDEIVRELLLEALRGAVDGLKEMSKLRKNAALRETIDVALRSGATPEQVLALMKTLPDDQKVIYEMHLRAREINKALMAGASCKDVAILGKILSPEQQALVDAYFLERRGMTPSAKARADELERFKAGQAPVGPPRQPRSRERRLPSSRRGPALRRLPPSGGAANTGDRRSGPEPGAVRHLLAQMDRHLDTDPRLKETPASLRDEFRSWARSTATTKDLFPTGVPDKDSQWFVASVEAWEHWYYDVKGMPVD